MSALDRLATPTPPDISALNNSSNEKAPPVTLGPQGALGPRPGQTPPMQMPAPNHAHTVAALRHFAALGKQLETALADPDLGKADIKSKVIDGMTKLVQDRMMAPAEAVQTLSTFPAMPFEQKKWVEQHAAQIAQARNFILTHHAAAFAGQGPQPTPDAGSHMDDLAGMMSAHYGGGRARS